MARRRACILVEAGSSPGRNPLLPPLRAALARHDVELVEWDPTGRLSLPPDAPPADIYLVKGDHPSVLTAAACLADAGAPCINSLEATSAAADKARVLARLVRAGLPVPHSAVAGDAAALRALTAGGPRFVKPVRGAHGEGARRLAPGEEPPRGGGPWLVQEVVEGTGFDLKTYGVGERVAVRRARFVPGVVDMPREPVADVDPVVLRHATAAARALGLVLFGVDFLLSPAGPVIVDVNAFPGYRGVDEAPGWIAEAVVAELGATR